MPSELGVMQQMMNDLTASRRSAATKGVPWIAEPVTVFGSVVTPAYGAGNQVVILAYTTPQNYHSLIEGVVFGFQGGPPGPVPVAGDIIFTVDVNRPLGITDIGYLEKDYSQVPFEIGALKTGPLWPVEFRHENGDVLRIKAYTTAHIQVGPTTALIAAINGWQWPYGELG